MEFGFNGPKFTIKHVKEILLFNKFFPIVVVKVQPENVVRWCTDGDFFVASLFSASRVQHICLHSMILDSHYAATSIHVQK